MKKVHHTAPNDAPTREQLAARVLANPFEYLHFGEIGRLFNFGEDTLTAIVRLGAPVVSKKINPRSLANWLETNREQLRALKVG